MIGLSSAQASAWTYLMGTTLAAGAYMAPAGAGILGLIPGAATLGIITPEQEVKCPLCKDGKITTIVEDKDGKKDKTEVKCKKCKGTGKVTIEETNDLRNYLEDDDCKVMEGVTALRDTCYDVSGKVGDKYKSCLYQC